MPTPKDPSLVWLAALIIGAVILLLVVRFLLLWKGFQRRLRYIQREIDRTYGEERRYWKRQKRLLWLSLIPLVPYRED